MKWSKLSSQSEGNLCKCRKYPTLCFQGVENYINENYILLAAGEGSTIKVPPTKKTFKFSFKIPAECPPSFESQHAEVKYCLKLIVARPWKCQKVFEREFLVKQNVDLNMNAKAQVSWKWYFIGVIVKIALFFCLFYRSIDGRFLQLLFNSLFPNRYKG